MKLTRKKLINTVKSNLEKLGFKEFKVSKGDWQGFFCKKLQNGLYLTIGLTIHRYYESAYTADYYLSKTTTIGAIWGDIPKKAYERPSFLLNEDERRLFQKGNVNSINSKDIWFDGNDADSVLDFLRVIEITEPRIINDTELIENLNLSKDVTTLANYSKSVKELVLNDEIEGTYSFIPMKEIDDIPILWFKASEKVLRENKETINAHTVNRLAADAYRQSILDNQLI